VIANALAILAAFNTARYLITNKTMSPRSTLGWYAILLAVALPFVWLFVNLDWDHEFVSPAANWVGSPIAVLFVPTAFFCFDLKSGSRLGLAWYVSRSLIELLLIPLWVIIWVYFEFLVLGWCGP
jgi:hypothetical protein